MSPFPEPLRHQLKVTAKAICRAVQGLPHKCLCKGDDGKCMALAHHARAAAAVLAALRKESP